MGGKWAILWVMVMWGNEAMRAQEGWMGDLEQWSIHEDTLVLQASAAGTASIWKCFSNDGPGWDVELRWVQDLAGSLNNFSALHFFQPSPGVDWESFALPTLNTTMTEGYGSGLFFKLGATGSEDALEGYRVTGSESIPEAIGSWEAGTWAGGLNHGFRLLANPENEGVAQWFARAQGSQGPWSWMAELPWENGEHCIGFQARFTASNVSAFGLTVEKVGVFSPDTLGPQLLDWSWSGDTLILAYDEPLAPADSVVIEWWTGEESVEWGYAHDLFQGLLKTLPPPPPPGVWLDISLPALSDTLGNLGQGTTLAVCRIIPGRASWRDLVISEVMADPTPNQGGPEMEWVEILNRGQEGVDLRDFQWWDAGSGPAAIQPFPGHDPLLFPGERAILSGMELNFQGDLKQYLVSGGMNLLDAGDEIGLRHLSGEAIDLISYKSDWWQGAGGGISIEIRHPGSCDGPSNWGPTRPGPEGEGPASTPGFPGQLEVDEVDQAGTPLVMEGLWPQTPSSGWFQFNQPLDPRCLPWVHSGPIGDLDLQEAEEGRIHIETAEVWEGKNVAFSLRGISRCTTSKITSIQPRQFNWEGQIGYFPRIGDLALTEIAAVPPALIPEWGEYVEWTNLSEKTLETGSVLVNGEPGSQRKILSPGEREARTIPSGLPNEKGGVLIAQVSGDTLERVLYGACWHTNARDETAGKSWVRRSLLSPSQAASNWLTSLDPRGGSPGSIDPAEDPADSPSLDSDADPRLIFAGVRSGVGVVLSNQPLRKVPPDWKPAQPPAEYWVAGWGNGRIWEVPAQAWNPADSIENYLGVRTPAIEPPGWLEVVNQTQTSEIENPESAGEWGWSLNEVLNNPVTGGEPFIEIQWSGAQDGNFISPLRWTTETIPQPADWKALGPYNWWIPKDKPVAWARCPSRLKEGNHLPAELPSLHGDRLLTLSSAPWMLQTDTLQLGDHRHSPWLWDTEGISLERLVGNSLSSETRGNFWFSSLVGSTPSQRNSQFLMHSLPDDHLLTLSSRTLTPGTSGSYPWIEIQLCISKTEEPRAAAGPLSIGVFDGGGRLLHEISTPQQVSPASGVCDQWIWDGRGPYGSYLQSGTYWIVASFAESGPIAWKPVAIAPVR